MNDVGAIKLRAMCVCMCVCALWMSMPSQLEAQEPKGTVYALLVGVNVYKDKRNWNRLKYTENDVNGVYKVLTKEGGVPSGNIYRLLGKKATKEAVLVALERLRKRAKAVDTVLLMFAMHGFEYNKVGYLVLHDTYRGKLRSTGLRSQDLTYDWKTERVVILLDACYSGTPINARGTRGTSASNFEGKGRVVLASSTQEQLSYEDDKLKHGLFSYALMEALSGKADKDGDGVVTLSEAYEYVHKRVLELSLNLFKTRQNPVKSGTEIGTIALSFPRVDKGRLKIGSNPPGATVYIDGVNEGKTPWEGVMEPGLRELELKQEGYESRKEKLRIHKNQRRELAFALRRLAPPEPPVPIPPQVSTVIPPPPPVIPPPPPESRRAGDRQTFTVDRTSFAVRFIPAGRFTMGSPTSEQDVVISDCVRSGSSQTDCNSWYRAESPQRVVELTRSFWKMETEVTQGQFQRVMGYNPSHFKNCGLNCPVESVNWHEACAFANALSRKQGFEECYTCSGSGTGVTCEVKSQYSGSGYYNCKGWRLPTEAEWEYAARSGVHAAIYKGKFEIKGFSNAPALDPIAWYSGNSGVSYEGGFDCSNWSEKQYSSSRCGTHPVGRKQSNMWGLHDMLGNVFEWVHDWYQDSYRGLTGKDPVNDRTGSVRVLRGGSWGDFARDMRAAYRNRRTPTNRYDFVGFRLLRGDLSSN